MDLEHNLIWNGARSIWFQQPDIDRFVERNMWMEIKVKFNVIDLVQNHK